MKTLAAALALTFSLTAYLPAQAADIQDGIQAFAAGDYDAAMKIYRELADQGDARGVFWMGYLHHYGHGVKKDQAEAYKLFQKSAAMGDVKARQYLGIMTQKGEGTQKDLVGAHMWYSLFYRDTDNNRDRPYARDTLNKMERKMSPEDIAQAKKMAAEWKAEK